MMNWREVNLSDVCSNIFAGGDVPKNNYSKFKTDKYQVPIFANGEKHKGLYGYTDIKKVTEQCITVSARGTIGYSEIRHEPFFPIVRLIVLVPNLDIIDLHFLKYAIQGIDFVNSGSSIPQLTVPMIKNYTFLLPSVVEQKCIVAILDEAFANIEQARANTEQNLKNARELFESYIQQVFSNRGEGWIETNLGCIAEFKNGLNFSQSSKGEKLKVVGVKDFKSNFMVPFEQLETVQIDGDLSEAYELKENDIITVRSNGNKRLIGRCLLMGKIDNKTSYSGFTIRIRLSNKNISPKFLAYYLKSSSTHELLINSGGGANISNLNQKILNSLPIAFPHFDQQIQLVDAIKKVEQESQELEKVYANKLILIEELKKSILQKAFTGELIK